MSEVEPQMNTQQDQTTKRNVIRVATIILVAAIVVAAFYFFLAWQLGAWQMYTLASIITAFVFAAYFAMQQIRIGKENRGIWIVIIGMYIVFPVAVTLIAEIGLIFASAVFLLTYLVSSQSLPPKQNRLALWIAVAVAAITASIDLLELDYRLVVPQIKAFVPSITGVIFLVTGYFVVRQSWSGNLRTKLIAGFLVAAILPLLVVGAIVSYQTYSTILPQALETQDQISKRVAEQVEQFIRERETELRLLTEVNNMSGLNIEDQKELLTSLLSAQDLYDELILVDSNGREQVYLSRVNIITEGDLGNRSRLDEFEQPKETKETYFSPVQFNENTGEPFMIISVPLVDLRTDEITKVLIANLRFKAVWNLMAEADVIGNGVVYLIDANQRVVAHANPSVVLQGTQVDLPEENAFTTGIDGVEVAMARTKIQLNDQEFDVVAELPRSDATTLATDNLITTIGVIVLIILLAASFGTFAARLITTPISELADAAQDITAGNLSRTVDVNTKDEIGALGISFNSMTSQLRELVGSLEQRVADRTAKLEESSTQIQKRASQLEAISDVANSVASLQDVDQLLPYITQTISERFGFYHVGIFLLSETKEYAILRAANSEGGQKMLARKHQLRVGQEGIVGYSADQKRARIALDVGEDAVYFNNPDLPSTRSELALPLIIGRDVIGVLDVQSEEANAFSNEDIGVLSTLANQVAVAIENARLFQQSQDALNELDKTFQRYISSEWRQFAGQSKVLGYRAYEEGLEPITKAYKLIKTKGRNKNIQKIPIKLRGTTLGSLNVDMGEQKKGYSEEELNLIQTVADRLALALESARLLEDSQREAAKEQVIGQITGKIGSSINLRNVLQTAVEELGYAIPGSEIEILLQSNDEKTGKS